MQACEKVVVVVFRRLSALETSLTQRWTALTTTMLMSLTAENVNTAMMCQKIKVIFVNMKAGNEKSSIIP